MTRHLGARFTYRDTKPDEDAAALEQMLDRNRLDAIAYAEDVAPVWTTKTSKPCVC